MRTVKELMKYYFLIYFKSPKFVMPFSAVLLFLYFTYSTAPTGIVESYTVSIVAGFLIMMWIGLTYNSLIDPVSEQLLILKAQSMLTYYISRVLFLFILGVIVSAVMTFFPVIQHIVNGFQLYDRGITAADIPASLLLHSLAGFAGGAAGSFLHQRIMKDRRVAIIITFGIASLALAKTALNDTYAIAEYVTWALPPIADTVKYLSDSIYFIPQAVLASAGYLLIYGLIVSGVQTFLLKLNKF